MKLSQCFEALTCLLLPSLLYTGLVCCFNVDISAPKIQRGEAGSYFSYSIAIFKNRNRQMTFLSTSPLQNEKKKYIEKCDMKLKSCSKEYIRPENPDNEGLFAKWFGSSLSTTSSEAKKSQALICAHRYYIPTNETNYALGLCYLIDTSFRVTETLVPCQDEDCQAGSSSDLSDNGGILMGAPTMRNGEGAAFGYDKDNLHKSTTYQSLDYINMQAGESVNIGRLINNKTTYIIGASNYEGRVYLYPPDATKTEITEPHAILIGSQYFSRFGFQTALGDFNQDGYEDLVVSAPFEYHDDHHGAIYLYNNGPKGIYTGMKGKRITGKKVSSCSKSPNCREARFGFSLGSVADLDLDGYPDLVVGAPFEGKGVVYVFSGSANSLSEQYSQRIEASQIDDSLANPSFGYSITKRTADLDENLYPDFVVGSYHNDKAFVLRTRIVVDAHVELTTNPITLNPKNQTCPISSDHFCFQLKMCVKLSLISNTFALNQLDLKYNMSIVEPSYPARASFHYFHAQDSLSGTLSYPTTSINIRKNKDGGNDGKCLLHEVYIMKNNRDFLNPVEVSMTINLTNLDVPNPGISKGNFYIFSKLESYPILRKEVSDTVYSAKVFFQSNCGEDQVCKSDLVLDLQTPVESIKASSPLAIAVKVRNEQEDAHLTQLFITIPPNVFYDKLSKASIPIICTLVKNTSLVCDIGNPMLKKQQVSFILTFDLRKITIQQNVLNFTFLVNTTSKEIRPEDNDATLFYNIQTEADLLLSSQSTPSNIYYKKQSSYQLHQALTYFEELESKKNTNNKIINHNSSNNKNNDKYLGPRLQHVFEVKNIGKSLFPESELLIKWPFKLDKYPLLYLVDSEAIINTQCSCSYDKRLLINPYNIIDTRSRETFEKRSQHSNNDNENIELDNLIERVKRSPSSSSSSLPSKSPSTLSFPTLFNTGKTVTNLSCSDSNVECTEILCSIEALEAGESAVVVVRSFFWNSTFQKIISDSDRVSLSIFSNLIPPSHVTQADLKNDHQQTSTLLLREELKDKEIPWWVYLLATLAGILVLLLFILCLWKCGFFDRTTYDKEQKYSVTLTTKDEVEKQSLNKRKN